jgi:hypothetical protein
LGEPSPIQTFLSYSVWSDFGGAGQAPAVRAAAGILATRDEEERIKKALAAFVSQARVMAATVAHERDRRRRKDRYLELYGRVELRRPIDYQSHFELVDKMNRRS